VQVRLADGLAQQRLGFPWASRPTEQAVLRWAMVKLKLARKWAVCTSRAVENPEMAAALVLDLQIMFSRSAHQRLSAQR
jgi:hypothetical protein